MSQTDLLQEFASSEFESFVSNPVYNVMLKTDVVVFKPVAFVDQSDLKFLTLAD
jgi:hypothetical protein